MTFAHMVWAHSLEDGERTILRNPLPSVRAALIGAVTVAFIGLVNADYPYRGPWLQIAVGQVEIGNFIFPYRWLLIACVVVVGVRLIADRRSS